MIDSKSLLSQNIAVYQGLIDSFSKNYEESTLEKQLAIINLIAAYEWRIHAGLYADLQLENWALSIGQRIWENNGLTCPILPTAINKLKILHVVTQTYSVGGHTRLLWNIIRNDTESLHNVVLLNRKVKDAPEWLHSAVLASGGIIISLCQQSSVEQVATLQQLLTKQADRIFYHIHPDDSVSVAALAATPRPQVLTINHSDHTFWLGSILSDIVVCYRKWSLQFSLDARAAQKVELLPTPLNFKPRTASDKCDARKLLKIRDGQIILLTVASAYKFSPSDEHNYYRLIKQVLDNNPQVVVKVVGVQASEGKSLGFKVHERIELLGSIEDPRTYYKAADIYVDSMPFSSFTSLFESMYFGCFPVLQFNPTDTLNIEQEPALAGLVSHSRDENEAIQTIQLAIDDVEYRHYTAKKGSELIQQHYMSKGWRKYLSALYRDSAEAVTSVRDIKNMKQVSIGVANRQNDLDAALLSKTFFGDAMNFMLYSLNERIDKFSIIDAIRIRSSLSKPLEQHNHQMTTKQLLSFVKKKLIR